MVLSEEKTMCLGKNKPLKQLNKVAKKSPLDIEFSDLVYSVKDSHSPTGWNQLLKSVNGKFKSGELTAIMGPSGAGKTTLLNILAGCVTAGVKGIIKINEHQRNLKTFNKLSAYIMQEDIVQPRLTVQEAMVFAANVKLPVHLSHDVKLAVVQEVINLLGLEQCTHTRTEYLSGGQRKRLSVALELVNNPPVIFLDEPTTGLDNYAIKQCMDLLYNISKLGRTIICTIHQPPASLFQSFDQVYILANGYCTFNGKPNELIDFLANAGFACPQYNTPADYMMEIVQGHKSIITILSNQCHNGKLQIREKEKSPPVEDYYPEGVEVYRDTTEYACDDNNGEFATPFSTQVRLLLGRMFLQMSRNKTMLYIQFFHHLLSGFLVGSIFYGCGNNASAVLAIFKYAICCVVFFMYTHCMSPVLLFPLEVKLMKYEYFNRWYSLRAYFVALNLVTAPLLTALGVMFCTIVYFMTYQPFEFNRFIGFCLIGLSLGFCSQGLGYSIGSMLSITGGSVVGPSVLAPLLALAVYGMGYKGSIETFMSALMSLSYVRYGIVGFCNTIFYERSPLECTDEIYCHYMRPQILMADMGMPLTHYKYQLGMIVMFTLLFRVSCFFSLKLRLNNDFSRKVMYYANKIIHQKH